MKTTHRQNHAHGTTRPLRILDERELAAVTGGLNPQPEPPGLNPQPEPPGIR